MNSTESSNKRRARRSSTLSWKIPAAIVVVGAIGAAGLYLQRSQPEPASVAVAPPLPQEPAPAPPQETQPAPPPAPVDTTPLVAAPNVLENSDGQVRAALSDFAPKLVQWFTPEEQIRKWVTLVNQVAEGKLPDKNRPFDYAMPAYKALQKGDNLRPDPANYRRTEQLINAITEIPVERLVHYYHAWKPALDNAYAELGGGNGFDKRLRLAIRRVIATRPLPPDMDLVRPVVYYKYADPQLEQANDIEKLTWRLGPENTKHLQEYLRRFEQLM